MYHVSAPWHTTSIKLSSATNSDKLNNGSKGSRFFRHTKFSKHNCLGSRRPPYMVDAPPTGNPGSTTVKSIKTHFRNILRSFSFLVASDVCRCFLVLHSGISHRSKIKKTTKPDGGGSYSNPMLLWCMIVFIWCKNMNINWELSEHNDKNDTCLLIARQQLPNFYQLFCWLTKTRVTGKL